MSVSTLASGEGSALFDFLDSGEADEYVAAAQNFISVSEKIIKMIEGAKAARSLAFKSQTAESKLERSSTLLFEKNKLGRIASAEAKKRFSIGPNIMLTPNSPDAEILDKSNTNGLHLNMEALRNSSSVAFSSAIMNNLKETQTFAGGLADTNKIDAVIKNEAAERSAADFESSFDQFFHSDAPLKLDSKIPVFVSRGQESFKLNNGKQELQSIEMNTIEISDISTRKNTLIPSVISLITQRPNSSEASDINSSPSLVQADNYFSRRNAFLTPVRAKSFSFGTNGSLDELNKQRDKDIVSENHRDTDDSDTEGDDTDFREYMQAKEKVAGISTATNPFGFRIDPNDKYKRIWNIFLVILVIYFSLVVPYRLAFDSVIDPYTSTTLFVFENCLNFCFLIDIVLNFYTGYVLRSGAVEYQSDKIARRYLQSWFIFDVLSIIPFDILLNPLSSSSFLLIPRLLRLARLVTLFRLLRLFKLTTSLSEYHKSRFFSNAAYKLFRIFLIVLIILHLLSCVWIFMANIEGAEAETWITHYNIQNAGEYVQYVSSIYFVMTFMTTTGFGDIVPVSNPEKIFITLMLALSSAGFAFLIGSMTTIVNSADQAETAFEQKLLSLSGFMQYRNISKDLFKRGMHFLFLLCD